MSATPEQGTSYKGKCIMATKKKAPTAPTAGLQTLKIGSRVRCTDDRIEGRIVWANGVSVKITWNDGEQVTWRRDSLAGRPIEILGGDEDQAEAPATVEAEQIEPPQAEQEPAAAAPEATATEPNAASADTAAATDAPATASEPTEAPAEPEAATEATTVTAEPMEGQPEPAAAEEAPTPTAEAAEAPPEAAAVSEPTQAVAKPKRLRKAPAEPKDKKLSALDAAAKVLAGKGYWTSPGGKTPAATLYSAMLREIATKGDQARFTKTGRGHFAYQGE
jgi:hypothetical protein